MPLDEQAEGIRDKLDLLPGILATLQLMTDPGRVKRYIKDMGDATQAYQKSKAEAEETEKRLAEEVERREAGVLAREIAVTKREAAIQQREDMVGDREERLRAVFEGA